MLIVSLLLLARSTKNVIHVGDGFPFATLRAAVDAAQTGDTIEIHPKAEGYLQKAVLVRVANLTIKGVGPDRIKLDAKGADTSGVGSHPRAVIQVDAGADGVVIEHLELTGASNESHNGAGVRINQARNVTVRDCDIHGNDMGIMSNGREKDEKAASGQLIDHCHVHHNGNLQEPGYNHNFYLGGTDATIQFCEVDHALTGHNIKSRAHYTKVQYCFVHDSANREMDFVEAWDTERKHSDAVLVGNVIVTDPDCGGNRGVVHFGREKGVRNGEVRFVNNTIVTPFASAVVHLSSPGNRAVFMNNIVCNNGQSNAPLADFEKGVTGTVMGQTNWLSRCYKGEGPLFDPEKRYGGSPDPGFVHNDYAVPKQPGDWFRSAATAPTAQGGLESVKPTHRYIGHKEWKPTTENFIGAG